MNNPDNMSFPQSYTEYLSPRKDINLPFTIQPAEQFVSDFEKIEGGMQVTTCNLPDLLRANLSGEKWMFSPKTPELTRSLAEYYLVQQNDSLVITPMLEKAEAKWQQYQQREKRGLLQLVSKIDSIDEENLNNTDRKRLSQLRELQQNDPNMHLNEESIQAYVNNQHDARISRSVNLQKNKLIRNSLKKFTKAIDIADTTIGRSDRGFFDMDLKTITTSKGSYRGGLLVEEPAYQEAYRQKHPIGIIILPTFTDNNGDSYVCVAQRNEPGSLSTAVKTAAEQTSLTKMQGNDILQQPGGGELAYCVQEMAAINCEPSGLLDKENIPEVTHILAYGNPARLGGGFKAYMTAEIKANSPLIERYEKSGGKWYRLSDVEAVLQSTNHEKPMINELLATCLFIAEQNENHKRRNVMENLRQNPEEAVKFFVSQIAQQNPEHIAQLISELSNITHSE